MNIRIVSGGEAILGPGRADLLAGIAETGSIAAAGRRMGMSYKRAWALVEAMNAAFPARLVAASKGGAGGGGARLTADGHEVLAAYRQLASAAASAGRQALERIAARAVPPAAENG